MSLSFDLQCWSKRLYRHGPRFYRHFQALQATRQLSADALERYRSDLLQRMIRHCVAEIPYYQDLFRQLRLTPEDIQRPLDLQKLPSMDKATVQANFDKLIARKRRNFLCREGTTSGTTGMPGRFLRDFNSINFENAAVWRHWNAHGDSGKRRVSLRGGIIVPSTQEDPPFWKYNAADRELLMSSYHLSFNTSRHYLEKILEFQPEVLFCGPSMGFLLARAFRHYGIDYRFEVAFTSSESLEPLVRDYIEEVFQCRIYDWYGQAERVAAISQCAQGTYHIEEDYALVELEPVPGEADHYELLGTHLHNYVMPLLRYRTQDVVLTRHNSCPCGSVYRTLDQILGRTYSYLLTPEGYHIAITTHIPTGVDNVLEVQFLQSQPGEVTLKVMTNGRFTQADREQLIRRTREHTSPRMKVAVEEVAHIPRGPGGKFVNIVSTVAPVQELRPIPEPV